MRILFVNIEGYMAGAEHSLLLLAEELGINHRIVVACPSNRPLEAALKQNNIQTRPIPVRPLCSHKSARNLIHWIRVLTSLVLHIRKFNPDFIHANTFYCAPPCLVAGLLTNTRVIVHARDMIGIRPLNKFIGKYSVKIVAVSHAVRGFLVEQGIPRSKIAVAHNGFDKTTKMAACMNVVTRPNHPSDIGDPHVFIFVNIGQFVPWKRQDAFLNAAYFVAQETSHCRFELVGDDIFSRQTILKDQLQRQCSHLDMNPVVQFLSWQQDLSTLWNRVHCLVHTAIQEPFGRVIVEAMANGIPVIALDSGGPSEIIRHNRTGLLVPPNDTQQLAQAMVKIATDRSLYQRISLSGQKHAHRNFTSSQTTQRVDNIYKNMTQTDRDNRGKNRIQFSHI